MSTSRERVSEMAACAMFIEAFVSRAHKHWPTLYAEMRQAYGDAFTVDNEEAAAFDWALAYIGQELPALRVIYPPLQAKRLASKVIAVFRDLDSEVAQYAETELGAYAQAWEEALENATAPEDLMNAIPTRLLGKWLDRRLEKVTSQRTGAIDPLLLARTTVYLTPVGWWKLVGAQMQLTEP